MNTDPDPDPVHKIWHWLDDRLAIEETLKGQGWFNYIRFPYEDHVKPRITSVLIRAIRAVNRHKNRSLAWELHDLADEYDPRPTGKWSEGGTRR